MRQAPGHDRFLNELWGRMKTVAFCGFTPPPKVVAATFAKVAAATFADLFWLRAGEELV